MSKNAQPWPARAPRPRAQAARPGRPPRPSAQAARPAPRPRAPEPAPRLPRAPRACRALSRACHLPRAPALAQRPHARVTLQPRAPRAPQCLLTPTACAPQRPLAPRARAPTHDRLHALRAPRACPAPQRAQQPSPLVTIQFLYCDIIFLQPSCNTILQHYSSQPAIQYLLQYTSPSSSVLQYTKPFKPLSCNTIFSLQYKWAVAHSRFFCTKIYIFFFSILTIIIIIISHYFQHLEKSLKSLLKKPFFFILFNTQINL